MEDIAPELYAKIEADFDKSVKGDTVIKQLVNKLNKGKPLSNGDFTTVASRLGKHASDAFHTYLTVDALPEGQMFWNIADRTVRPIMNKIYETENGLQILSQHIKDKAAGVNISIVKGMDPVNRIDEVLDFAVNSKTGEELYNALDLPVQTTALDFNDDFMRQNGEIRNELGFEQTVIREYDGVGLGNGTRPCNWCIGRAGTWTFQEAKDNGVFERHTGCGCTIEIVSSDEVENDEIPDVPF